MARTSRHEKHKPQILRLLSEGLKPSDIAKQFPAIPTSTVYAWAKEFQNISRTGGDSGTPAPLRLPIDPESPLERIIQALWDIHANPTAPGAGLQVQALQALMRAVQIQAGIGQESPSKPSTGISEDALREVEDLLGA
jgi:hypothetical protein